MDIPTCQSIVQSFFSQAAPKYKHVSEQNLVLDGQSYPVRPDDTYYLADTVIAIEYEDTKRPVESITKYWWLLMNTNWLSHNKKLKCAIFPLRTDFVKSRIEVIPILGSELANKYPDSFEFGLLMPADLNEASIQALLAQLLQAPTRGQ